jgi:2-methylcitrate dehydratase PrpD
MMTQKMASFIVETDYDQIPKEAIRNAKTAIVDCLGIALASSTEPAVQVVTEQVRRMGAVSEAGVICQGFKTVAELAAWVNGTVCHTLDYDDVFPSKVGYNCHPTVAILPAVMALGEKYGISGKNTLLAYIIGIEAESRVGLACGKPQSELGWHPTSILGSIGAAAAAAKVLGLTTAQVQVALGIASSLACGLRQNFGTMTKSLHAGNAARNGVVAGLLAKNHFTANKDILDGPFGFCNVFSAGKGLELANVVRDLGDSWHTFSPGISIKPYPSCRAIHSSIDAILHLKKEHHIEANEVAEVTCNVSPMIPDIAIQHKPTNALEGKFSLEYCVAIALIDGEVTLKQFTDEKVLGTEAQNLLQKIRLAHPENWPTGVNLTQEVIVRLKDGREYSHRVNIPKGDPKNPMTDEEILTKFKDCARLAPVSLEAERLLELIHKIESLDNIVELMNVMTYGSNRQGDIV